jgi:hypothetical protein
VYETLCSDQSKHDQHESCDSLDPWRAAKEQPPQKDEQSADYAGEQRHDCGLGKDRRHHEPTYPLQDYCYQAGPHANRFARSC